jgi:hypothetical protein
MGGAQVGTRIRRDAVDIVERQTVRTPRPPARILGERLSLTAAARPADRFKPARRSRPAALPLLALRHHLYNRLKRDGVQMITISDGVVGRVCTSALRAR